MTQVKFNNEKWWVLHQESWREIEKKDWEKVKMKAYEFLFDCNPVASTSWQPTSDQIYSLPDEVEFEIKRDCKFNDGLCDEYEDDKLVCKCKQVAHLKESDPTKEEYICSHGCITPSLECLHNTDYSDYNDCAFYKKVERSEEVKKEPLRYVPFEKFLSSPLRLQTGNYFSEKEILNAADLFKKQFVSKDSQSEIQSLREELYTRDEMYEIWQAGCSCASAYEHGHKSTADEFKNAIASINESRKLSPKEEEQD